ncbi:Asp-tRNA(Asn)/Glu-tRNA(Gln) amidotransferase subunit GatC [Candidatus Bipolaricaulota bacterium]|nr:Asp-tRNA(Asn)/Glu-tRNA(Gln) amidotransferase subunit GatC [Candidatus Bipolaricaulota bacterium]
MIDKESVKHVEDLAELSLTESEREELTDDLARILDYVDKLGELDTEGVEPLRHILEVQNVMRDDEKRETLDSEEVFRNAPARDGNFFQVPPVIDKDSSEG